MARGRSDQVGEGRERAATLAEGGTAAADGARGLWPVEEIAQAKSVKRSSAIGDPPCRRWAPNPRKTGAARQASATDRRPRGVTKVAKRPAKIPAPRTNGTMAVV